jgi:hypothetical protein
MGNHKGSVVWSIKLTYLQNAAENSTGATARLAAGSWEVKRPAAGE